MNINKNVDNENFDNDTFNFMKNKSYSNLPVNELVNLPIFYINLDRSLDRFELFNNQIKKYNIDPNQVTRISAVDGKTLDVATIKHKIHKDSKNDLPVISCMLSHFKAIKEAYESHHPYVVIMEDDCNFEYVPFQRYKLSDIANFLGETYNVIQLTTITYNYENKKLKMSPKFIIPGYKDSCVAYVINRIGMKNILDKLMDPNTEIHLADTTIYILAEQSCYLTKPYFIYFNSTITNTTIHLLSNCKYEDDNKNVWDNYYKVVPGVCDKGYIINLLNLNYTQFFISSFSVAFISIYYVFSLY